MRQHIAIASAADDGYGLPAAAMIRSVVRHLPAEWTADFYFIDGGLSEATRDRLQSCCDSRIDMHWLPALELNEEELPDWGRLSSLTYQRLLLPQLVDDKVDRVLYLDSDLVINRSLEELWNEPQSGRALLAAQDLAVPYVSSAFGLQLYHELRIPAHRKYFNAGVLIFDLTVWRRRDLTRRCLAYLRDYYESVVYHDQDALNAVVGDDWRELDPRWNQIASIAGQRFLDAAHLSVQDYRRLAEDPWIIHFAGTFKPWTSGCAGPGPDLFFDYLDETPWRGWRPVPKIGERILHFYERRLRPIGYPLEAIYLGWKAGIPRPQPVLAPARRSMPQSQRLPQASTGSTAA